MENLLGFYTAKGSKEWRTPQKSRENNLELSQNDEITCTCGEEFLGNYKSY